MIELSNDYTVPVKATFSYPFAEMTSGQSFFLPGDKMAQKLCAAIYSRRLSRQFTVRTTTENGVLGARCFKL